MPISDFEIIKKLGEGSYSTVYKVIRKSDSKHYALKQINFGVLKEKEKQNALTEIRILASINHPNIISYKETFFNKKDQILYLIMEYADGGDLQGVIQEQKKRKCFFKENEIWHIILQIVSGVKVLHDMNILHRDLKSANIFLTKDRTVKIGDMNVSKIIEDGMGHTQTGTPYYASPEVWKDIPYDCKSDIWSLGCILYEMCTLDPPFKAKSMSALFKKVLNCEYQPIPLCFSFDLKNLVASMLKLNPGSRPDCDQILQSHAFLKPKLRHHRAKSKLIGSISYSSHKISDVLPPPRYMRFKSSHFRSQRSIGSPLRTKNPSRKTNVTKRLKSTRSTIFSGKSIVNADASSFKLKRISKKNKDSWSSKVLR